jgi:hypothetical protein
MTIQSTSFDVAVTFMLFSLLHISIVEDQFINLSHLRECGNILDLLNS